VLRQIMSGRETLGPPPVEADTALHMHDIIAALRKEHSNITQLLDILDHQVAKFDRGEDPDYEIVESIVDYFQSFPDLYHHPKEDLVFRRLQQRDAAAAARVGDLQREHEDLAARTRAFASGVRAVLDEAQVPRQALRTWAREFIDGQREHMQREERLFFPAALRSLTAEDWADIKLRMTDHEDPLFGADVGRRYESLHRDIVAWARGNRTG
jgi:hemerythrin-like domain-containing protein